MMNTLPIQMLFQNIQRLDQKITLKSGQIFSGKVLAIFPGNLAEIQLAGNRMSARLDTGLSVDKGYYFQVLPEKSNGLPSLKMLGTKEDTSALNVLGAKNQPPAIKAFINEMADKQIPITKELLNKAGNWLKDSPSLDRSIQALKMMIVKNLPQTEATYRALYHVQEQEPLVNELTGLQKSIQNLPEQMEVKVLRDVQRVLQRVMTIPEQQRTIDGTKQLLQMSVDPKQNPVTRETATNLLKRMQLVTTDSQLATITSRLANGERLSDGKLLQLLNLKGSVHEAESHIQTAISKLSTEEWNSYTRLTGQQVESSPRLNLIELLRGLGLTFESDLMHQQLNELNKNGQLKTALLQALEANLPMHVRDKIEGLIHRLTGQQLIHSSDNTSFTSLYYQIPFQFNGWKSDVIMKWDTKKEATGRIDENYSRILFYLDLQNLKETVIDMNVQNRIITLKIINESESIQPFITTMKEGLRVKLDALDYTLSSIKLEKPHGELRKPKLFQPTDPTVQGVDYTV